MAINNGLKEYIIGVYAPELMQKAGLTKESAISSINFMIKCAEADQAVEPEYTPEAGIRAVLTTMGTGGALGGAAGILNAILSKTKKESILDLLGDAAKKALLYGALGTGIGGAIGAIHPPTAMWIGGNIYKGLFE